MLFHLEKLNQLIEENDLEKTLAFIKENSFQDLSQTESEEEPAPFWKRIAEEPQQTLPYFYRAKEFLNEREYQLPPDELYLRLAITNLDLAIVKLNLQTPEFIQSVVLQHLIEEAGFCFGKLEYSRLATSEYNNKFGSFLLLKRIKLEELVLGCNDHIEKLDAFKLIVKVMNALDTQINSLFFQFPYSSAYHRKQISLCKKRIDKTNELFLSVKKEFEERPPLQKILDEFHEKFAMEKTALENKLKDVSAYMDFNRLEPAFIMLQEREQIIDEMQKYYDEHPELHCDEIQNELNEYQRVNSYNLDIVKVMLQTQENSKLQANEEQDEKAQFEEPNDIDGEPYNNTPESNKSDDGLSPIPITSLSLHSEQYQSDNSYKHKQKSCSRGDFPSSNHSALFNREFKPTPQNNINSNDNNINNANKTIP